MKKLKQAGLTLFFQPEGETSKFFSSQSNPPELLQEKPQEEDVKESVEEQHEPEPEQKEEESPDAVSEYERARMETIARNREFLSRIAGDSVATGTIASTSGTLLLPAQSLSGNAHGGNLQLSRHQHRRNGGTVFVVDQCRLPATQRRTPRKRMRKKKKKRRRKVSYRTRAVLVSHSVVGRLKKMKSSTKAGSM